MCEYITSDLQYQASSPSQGASSYLFRAKSHAPEGQGSLLPEWSQWSRESSLVYDTKSQAAEFEILDTESGEIQTLTVKNKGKKTTKKTGLESRDERFKLQSLSRGVLGRDWRVSKCNRCMIHLDLDGGKKIPRGYAGILKGEKGGAFFGGLVQCGSVWTCPVCGAKIAERRADELRTAMTEAKKRGLHVALLTATVRHGVGDEIGDLLPKLAKAQTSFWGRRKVKDTISAFGNVGRIRSLEVTYGSSGWHPHVHILVFSEQRIPKSVKRDLALQWQKSCVSAGLPKPTLENGFDVRNGDAAGEYVCKFADDSKLPTKTKNGDVVTWDSADEMTKSHAKKGRQGNITPFDMLRLIGDRETSDSQKKFYRARFDEYAKAFKGRRQLVWSRGLRDEFDMGKELTDEELVLEQKEESNLIALLDRKEMAVLNKFELRSTALAIIENGGRDALATMLHPFAGSDMTLNQYRDFLSSRMLRKDFGHHHVTCGCGESFSFSGEEALCPSCATRVKANDEVEVSEEITLPGDRDENINYQHWLKKNASQHCLL
ncbi:protein rep [Vibrio parahaemolyticus]|nr:protein rep [Vibrio parahaemolyticus]MCX8794015.1 protein rep [Vibrio parahaemolyticus]MCX8814296.1 protein rep [Vibrio parahaemolyticus]MCX8845205.1 protein rep [Vibrio parahaemolyticus]MCX8875398.1 protein rep [Vibrio parahaemolyticus]MCX8895586.1 protein rep [Vibrio parahaemolyticus]